MECDERSASFLLYNIILNDIANGRDRTATKLNHRIDKIRLKSLARI